MSSQLTGSCAQSKHQYDCETDFYALHQKLSQLLKLHVNGSLGSFTCNACICLNVKVDDYVKGDTDTGISRGLVGTSPPPPHRSIFFLFHAVFVKLLTEVYTNPTQSPSLADPRMVSGTHTPLGTISFIVMQFSGKSLPNNRLVPPPPPLGLAPSRLGNSGSATDQGQRLTDTNTENG